MINLRSVNLNLLPVLRQLLRYRNVTQAADVLNMSQSAVSDALRKLRDIFNDELLVQEGRIFILTALAERLEPLVDDALNRVENLIDATNFDPAKLSGTMRIAAADYAILAFGTKLIRRLHKTSPGLTVQFQDLNSGTLSALKKGLLDFMLVPEVTTNSSFADMERTLLFEDDIVCVVDAASPLSDRLDSDTYWAAKHVFFSPRSDVFAPSRPTVLQQMGDRRLDSSLVPSYMLLPFLVEGTEVIALVQRRLADKLAAAAAVRLVEPPFPVPKMRIYAVWSRSRNREPLHSWFRNVMFDVAQTELSSPLPEQAEDSKGR